VYAREVCSPCHAVTTEQASQRRIVIATDFQTIANTSGMTATVLCAFLQTPHPKMPNLILTAEQSADVIAFLLSLRESRKQSLKSTGGSMQVTQVFPCPCVPPLSLLAPSEPSIGSLLVSLLDARLHFVRY
jgi:hypothetical protein